MKKSIYNPAESKFDFTDERYHFLFLYEDAYAIFRNENAGQFIDHNSSNYDLVYYKKQSSNKVPEDVLKDLFYLIRAGELDVFTNDIICIKINGFFSAFRFMGVSNHILSGHKNFIEVKDFVTEERMGYISALHRNNKILSVLDGKVYPVSDFDNEKTMLYCIDTEIFKEGSKGNGIKSDYSLYQLYKHSVKTVNPCSRPFFAIAHALYYFSKYQKQNRSSILLFNRQELEMVNDYQQLNLVAKL